MINIIKDLKNGNFDFKNISMGTILRTIVLGFALVNQLLVTLGYPIIEVKSEDLEMWLTNGLTIVTALIAWWKNNSFTKQAQSADEAMGESKKHIIEE